MLAESSAGARRDVALVLSGGGMNAVLLELGFLQCLRTSSLWPRIGWIYGTSAGALTGTMAALDRLDDLERFVLSLQPNEAFRPHPLWQLPFVGLHDYALPQTISERLDPPEELARQLAASPVELVVVVTDVSIPGGDAPHEHAFERAYSSRAAAPALMGQAVLASAAISALVLPIRVGEVIGTDGGWVRNFPLGHAYDNRNVAAIVGFRYLARHAQPDAEQLSRVRRRLEPFRAVPPVRALIAELTEVEARQARGEPAHLPDMIVRLMRIAIARNTALDMVRRNRTAARALSLDDPVERARKAVTARIRDAIRRIGRVAPALGRHLEASVSTGVRCTYAPRGESPGPT